MHAYSNSFGDYYSTYRFSCLVLIFTAICSLFISLSRPRLALSNLKLHWPWHHKIFISISRLELKFNLPRRSFPRWLTFTVRRFEYKDSEHHVTIAEIRVTFWVFPLQFGFSNGPLLSVRLNDFRVLVFTSMSTPGWMQRLRMHLVDTILQGELNRLDTFKMNIVVNTADETPSRTTPDGSEARVTASTGLWHTYNPKNNRMYTHGSIQAQLRRSWQGEGGSFVLIVKESQWVKLPQFDANLNSPNSWWYNLRTITFGFPREAIRLLRDPWSAIDIYVTRTDVTFEEFRIRDAELPKQAAATLRERWGPVVTEPETFSEFVWDSFARFTLG